MPFVQKVYCLGFVFGPNQVILIKKARSVYKGMMNGIGGEVHVGENNLDAMARECLEETGFAIPRHDWIWIADLSAADAAWLIHVHAASLDANAFYAMNTAAKAHDTDEPIEILELDLMDGYDFRTAPHVRALIAHARDRLKRPDLYPPIRITEVR